MRLNMALYTYGITFLNNKGFTPIQPPFFMKKDKMGLVAELDDYDETLYKIEGKGSQPDDKNDKKDDEDKKNNKDNKDDDNTMYMIATAEQPLSAIFSNEWVQPTELPIR